MILDRLDVALLSSEVSRDQKDENKSLEKFVPDSSVILLMSCLLVLIDT